MDIIVETGDTRFSQIHRDFPYRGATDRFPCGGGAASNTFAVIDDISRERTKEGISTWRKFNIRDIVSLRFFQPPPNPWLSWRILVSRSIDSFMLRDGLDKMCSGICVLGRFDSKMPHIIVLPQRINTVRRTQCNKQTLDKAILLLRVTDDRRQVQTFRYPPPPPDQYK